jgi:hypothetical protein
MGNTKIDFTLPEGCAGSFRSNREKEVSEKERETNGPEPVEFQLAVGSKGLEKLS